RDPLEPMQPTEEPGTGEGEEIDRRALIAETAYFIAEGRGFTPGGDVEDWLAAENSIDLALSRPAVR
ncbi:MAG: DUF2934 domain-containing protein, partial [Rubrivivax sp.]|nr:DUF2934 domain-containing protein [Rubrivivax sp.]